MLLKINYAFNNNNNQDDNQLELTVAINFRAVTSSHSSAAGRLMNEVKVGEHNLY